VWLLQQRRIVTSGAAESRTAVTAARIAIQNASVTSHALGTYSQRRRDVTTTTTNWRTLPVGDSHALADSVAPRFFVLSALLHVTVVGVLLFVTTGAQVTREATRPDDTASTRRLQTRIVFLATPGPGGGGGGGGNRQPGPVPRAEAPGHDAITIPVARRLTAAPAPIDASRPVQQVLIDATPLASGMAFVVGLPDAQPAASLSRGPGEGGGVGSGIGTGIGSGRGPGMGPGSGGGTGGGVYQIGSGVTPPEVLKQVRPTYTPDALRAMIQGSVVVELVVQQDGTPARIRVVRSLDPGLDQMAIEAVREWRFKPGRLGDTPVDVLVTIILDFNVR
jgi:periplasmic protein TonB